ncbi:hypothetical protein PMAYCL1PPCAC_15477, partial [Pristionchus mayeri]
ERERVVVSISLCTSLSSFHFTVCIHLVLPSPTRSNIISNLSTLHSPFQAFHLLCDVAFVHSIENAVSEVEILLLSLSLCLLSVSAREEIISPIFLLQYRCSCICRKVMELVNLSNGGRLNANSSQAEKMPRRKRAPDERQQCPEICVGCGAGASGYHYEAASCTSCKTFFRRTVLSGKSFTSCIKITACAMSGLMPCRSCRFDRCIDGGMNPFIILGINGADSNAVVQSAVRRMNCSEPSTSNSSSPEPATKRVISPTVFECTIDRIIGSLLHLETAYQTLRYCEKIDPRPNEYRLDTLIILPSLLNKSKMDSLEPKLRCPKQEPMSPTDRSTCCATYTSAPGLGFCVCESESDKKLAIRRSSLLDRVHEDIRLLPLHQPRRQESAVSSCDNHVLSSDGRLLLV